MQLHPLIMIGICVLSGHLPLLRAAASGEVLNDSTMVGFRSLSFSLLILAVTKPLGVFMAGCSSAKRTFLDPVLRPIERLLYRMTGVNEDTGNALDGICHRDADVQRGLDGRCFT